MSAEEEIVATNQFIDDFNTKINDITNNTIMSKLQKKTYKGIFITLLQEIKTQKYEYLDEAYKKKLNDLLDPSSEGGKRKSKKSTFKKYTFRKGITKSTFKKSKKSKKRKSKKFRR